MIGASLAVTVRDQYPGNAQSLAAENAVGAEWLNGALLLHLEEKNARPGGRQ
ncbi:MULTISPECIES: hypothetical protein [unclassified Rhizobium]|uniref:hypothetical protein n=1 Tax=unclassified Rhizobium TaxID=2613769 RepID=UPI00167E89FF|nr:MULTISPECIES: hypothetical protein [unclassified Rhizobium]